MITADLVDTGLSQHIQEFAAGTDRAVEDVSRQAMKGLVRYAIDLTPPSTGIANKEAQRRGERAIMRDLSSMGFEPVTIKGYREIKTVFGHDLATPVRVPTKENPRFADPESFRRSRLASKHGGRPTRGGPQAFYVDRRKFRPMVTRLFAEVGRLASGFYRAARELGVAVPSWISRHGQDRGTGVELVKQGPLISLRVTNHFPEGIANEIYEGTLRRLEAAKHYVANDFARQLEAKMKGLWGRR
jgi:hypothetical protein